jgi:CHAT domain-containing protein/Tfp pilus assembly protein PilF
MPRKGGVKMVRINRIKIVFIMVFFFSALVFPQEKQADPEKKLREEILAVYQSKGEQGIRGFFKKEKDKITNKFIVDFAEAGLRGRKEDWLKVCEIMAEEKKDKKTQADVLLKIGSNNRVNSNFEMAFDYYEKALPIYKKLNDLIGQGSVYIGKSDIYLLIGDYSKVLEMCDKALPLLERAGSFVGQGHVCLRRGAVYSKTGNKKLAKEMYEKALSCFEKTGDPYGLGYSYLKKGIICYWEYSRALALFDKAIPFLEKIDAWWGLSELYYYKASIYSRIGKANKAIESIEKVRHISERCGDFIGQGNAYRFLGDVYSNSADNSKALEMYDKALYFYEKGGDTTGLGSTYLNKGSVYLYMGDNFKASELLDKALIVSNKLNNPLLQGWVYQLKGTLFYFKGNNSKSLEMYNKALDFYKKAGDSLHLANLYVDKGTIYLRTCNYSMAHLMYQKAMLFYEKSEEPHGKGNVYFNEGYIYFLKNNFSKALDMYDKALTSYKKAGDPISIGNLYLRKGGVYLKKGDNLKALKMYEEAQKYYSKAEHKLGMGRLYSSKGDVYFNVGENTKAIELYNRAINLYSEIGEIEGESQDLHKKAKVLVKKRKIDKARILFKKGISKLEKIRIQNVSPKMKMNYMGMVYNQYEEVAVFMLENNNYEEGFKYAQRLKARVFLEQLSEGLLKWEKGIAPELKEKRDKLLSKLSILSKDIHEVSNRKDNKKLQMLKENYHQVEDEFEELLIKIRLNNPIYASVRYPEPISVQDLQKEVLKKGEILVRYFISPDKLYVFVISKKNFKVVPLKIKKEKINFMAKESFLPALRGNQSFQIKRYGKIFYQKLIKPLESELKKARKIIIIPDEQLVKIPFESFIIDRKKSGRSVFLLEKYRVKYIQSASLLAILRKLQRDRKTNGFIGFGDPVYEYENFKQRKSEQGSVFYPHENEDEIKEIHRSRYVRAGGIINRLQDSGVEVKTIARLFEKESLKTMVHLREQASEDNAKERNMKDFAYIHFACHGLLDEDFQSLLLSQLPPDKSKEDGYFTLNEIMNCDYNAKLVVLSACETGLGKMYKGEGVTGLTRAVMYAGTPAVVATLWDVDDKATKELMLHFYRNMLEKNLDKAEALRQAKLEFLKNKEYRSPLFWSAFVMYGE